MKTDTKICTKCGRELPATEEFFYKDKYQKNGLKSHCKICEKEYRDQNKERSKQYGKEYRKQHKEEKKQYYLKHKEKINEKRKEYYSNNKELINEKGKEYNKIYREINKQKIKERRQAKRDITYKKEISRLYNLTIDEYNKKLQNQNNECFICKKELTTRKYTAIDHCHISGKVRGILCRECNLALGLVKEDTNILKSMITYLEQHK